MLADFSKAVLPEPGPIPLGQATQCLRAAGASGQLLDSCSAISQSWG